MINTTEEKMTTAAPRVNQKDQSILPFIFRPGPFIHSHPFVWELLFYAISMSDLSIYFTFH